MIEEIEGATAEPTRRRHVVALSAAVATVSLVLLMALIGPAPRTGTPPLAASPAPSPASMTVAFASDSTGWVSYEQALQSDVTSTVCAAGIGASPSVTLVFDREGRPIAAYTSGKTGRFIPLPHAYVGSGWLTVPCDTSDIFAPRINRAR
jgi:hypothetical protein